MKKICEIIKKNEDKINYERIYKAMDEIDDFFEDHIDCFSMEDYNEMIEEIENDFNPFLNCEQSKYYCDNIVNEDGSKGAHFTEEQVSNTLKDRHIPTETDNYGFYDIYTQINLIYSDLGKVLCYDNDKIIMAALAYLNDVDFPGKDIISYTKWYCEAKKDLKEDLEEE